MSEMAKWLMSVVADAERDTGHHVDGERHLPPSRKEYTMREVADAVGAALSEAGIPNNLRRER